MAILIKGGRIITADADRAADVLIEGERIAEVAESIDCPDADVIDASGKYVFPGFIDPHVHIHLPFMGTNALDDHASATKAALAGGTTTVIEMICPGPDDEPRAAFEEWKALAEQGACCDFTFHLSVVRFDELAKQQVRELVASEGVASFKVFLAYKGALDIADEQLFELMEIAKELGMDGVLVVPGAVTSEVHYDDGYARALEAFSEVAPFAEDIGVTIAIEYVWNKFLLSPLEWKRFIEEVGSDRVGLFFDTGNMTIFGFPEQWVKIIGKGVKKVHFKDFKRPTEWTALLEGDVDFPAVMAELRNIGFDGCCLSEVSPGIAPIEDTAAAIRKILEM